MDFCSEACLGKYHSKVSPHCGNCSSTIVEAVKLSFCVKLGNEVKQFCGPSCQEEFRKRIKICAFCQKDVSRAPDSFMAPVSNGTTFHDFCSPICHSKFEDRVASLTASLDTKPSPDKGAGDSSASGAKGRRTRSTSGLGTCAVCGKMSTVKHEITFENRTNKLCSDPCFAAFRYANKLDSNLCDNCNIPCDSSALRIQFEGVQKKFCNTSCLLSFRVQRKKVVPCTWCATKRVNFDMIERTDKDGKYQLFCSLNCMSLYRVNIQASSNKNVKCDQCHKFVPAQYHLTMSDASVRNFCSYTCVMAFQSQFSNPQKAKPTTGNTNAMNMNMQKRCEYSNHLSFAPSFDIFFQVFAAAGLSHYPVTLNNFQIFAELLKSTYGNPTVTFIRE